MNTYIHKINDYMEILCDGAKCKEGPAQHSFKKNIEDVTCEECLELYEALEVKGET